MAVAAAACAGDGGSGGSSDPTTIAVATTAATVSAADTGPAPTVDRSAEATSTERVDPAGTGRALAPKPCPDGATAEAVTITTLHFWDDRVLDLVEAAAADFEAAHPGVELRFEKSRGGADALALLAAQPSDDRAEVVTLPDMSTAAALELGAFQPVGACGLDPTSLVPSTTAAYTVDDVLWAAPFTVSAPILYYDRDVFRAAGLDPDDPPSTVDELAAAARQIVATDAREVGLVLEAGPFSGGAWYVEQFAAQLGVATFEPANGREGEVQDLAWDHPAIVRALGTLQRLVADGTGAAELIDASDGTADLLRLLPGERAAAMTVHTSGSLGVVLDAMEATPERVGIAPFPAVDDTVEPAALAGGAALWLTAGHDPAEVTAAREWVQFLTSPAVQGRLASANGFVPTAIGAESSATYAAEAAAWPQLLVAGRSLLPGTSPAELAPLHPAWEDVRYVLAAAVEEILAGGADPAATLAAAAHEADALLVG